MTGRPAAGTVWITRSDYLVLEIGRTGSLIPYLALSRLISPYSGLDRTMREQADIGETRYDSKYIRPDEALGTNWGIAMSVPAPSADPDRRPVSLTSRSAGDRAVVAQPPQPLTH